MSKRTIMLGLVSLSLAAPADAATSPASRSAVRRIGVFTRDSDVGAPSQKGGASFDAATRTYRVIGNGDDLWAAKDDFHFLNRKASGDVAITATITPASGSNEPHSKAGLMIRQALTPDSPYVDVVVHQNGLVALQYRSTPGGPTREIAAPQTGPGRFRLERRGDYVSVALSDATGKPHQLGDHVQLKLHGPYYVGLLVCSHSDTQTKTVDFEKVEFSRP